MSSLVDDQGKDITDQKQILETVFYQNLYTSRDETLDEANLEDLMENFDIQKLKAVDKLMLDREIDI